jgi:hypothetical protein
MGDEGTDERTLKPILGYMKCSNVGYIHLAHYRDQFSALANTITNPSVSYKVGNLTSPAAITMSWRTRPVNVFFFVRILLFRNI